MGVFDDIYSGNIWGFGSGHGSLPRVTKGYRAFLEMFIRENDIRSIVDYGCGDWQFSRLINWGKAQYTGVDVVPDVVERNKVQFGNDSIRFQTIKPGGLPPKADLLIVKDVLQHLSEDVIRQFITAVLPRYQYALITNCILPETDLNRSIADGEFRPLDLRQKPFSLPGEVVYSFTGPKSFSRSERKFFPAWKKRTILLRSV